MAMERALSWLWGTPRSTAESDAGSGVRPRAESVRPRAESDPGQSRTQGRVRPRAESDPGQSRTQGRAEPRVISSERDERLCRQPSCDLFLTLTVVQLLQMTSCGSTSSDKTLYTQSTRQEEKSLLQGILSAWLCVDLTDKPRTLILRGEQW